MPNSAIFLPPVLPTARRTDFHAIRGDFLSIALTHARTPEESEVTVTFHYWLSFAAAWLVATLSPGPNVLLVVRNALRHGRGAIAITVAGNLCAQLITTGIVALGIGELMVAHSALFLAIKSAGAAGLILVGVRQIFSRASRSNVPDVEPLPFGGAARIFRDAFVVSATNPSALIALIAAMPQFIQHDESIFNQVVVMYLTVAVTIAVIHTAYALVACGVRNHFLAFRSADRIKRCSGAVFIMLGIRMLVPE